MINISGCEISNSFWYYLIQTTHRNAQFSRTIGSYDLNDIAKIASIDADLSHCNISDQGDVWLYYSRQYKIQVMSSRFMLEMFTTTLIQCYIAYAQAHTCYVLFCFVLFFFSEENKMQLIVIVCMCRTFYGKSKWLIVY